MKIKTNVIGNAILVGLHVGNLVTPFIPSGDKFIVAAILGFLQLVLAVIAHYSNPNGTSVTLPYGLSDEQFAQYKQIFDNPDDVPPTKNYSPLKIVAFILVGLAIASPARAQTFASLGASAVESTAPHIQPAIAFATPITSDTGLYSFTIYQPSISNHQIVNAGCSGIAVYMRTFGPLDLYGTAAPCVAATSTATSGAGMAGAVGLLHIGKTNWRAAFGYNLIAGPVATSHTLQIGLGYQFSKTITLTAPPSKAGEP